MKTRLDHCELWPEVWPNNLLNRIGDTLDYLETQNISGRVADCGEDNPMKQAIVAYFDIDIHSLDWDFNWEYPHNYVGHYDVIFCFEVLEHLFNPLLFLRELRGLLSEGGVIYLSTPRQWPQYLSAVHHYHEIPTDRLMWLFDAAGLTVDEVTKVTIAGNWYDHLHGVRPMLRYFQKTRLFKLR